MSKKNDFADEVWYVKISNNFGKFIKNLWWHQWWCRVLVVCIVVAAIFFSAFKFLHWSAAKQQQTKQAEITNFTELCQKVNGGVPVAKVFLGVNPQYFCEAADGRLARVLFHSQNIFDWVDDSNRNDILKDWDRHGREACTKAGLKNPTYLSQLGFFCETENGELIPVFHPDEKFVRPPGHY